MRTTLGPVVVVACLAMLSCGNGEASLQDQVVGTWVTAADIYVVFHEDGTHAVGHSLELALGSDVVPPELEHGSWTVEGNTLTFRNDPESAVCPGMIGTYEIEIVDDGDRMLATLEGDECEVRAEDWGGGGLTRWSSSAE